MFGFCRECGLDRGRRDGVHRCGNAAHILADGGNLVGGVGGADHRHLCLIRNRVRSERLLGKRGANDGDHLVLRDLCGEGVDRALLVTCGVFVDQLDRATIHAATVVEVLLRHLRAVHFVLPEQGGVGGLRHGDTNRDWITGEGDWRCCRGCRGFGRACGGARCGGRGCCCCGRTTRCHRCCGSRRGDGCRGGGWLRGCRASGCGGRGSRRGVRCATARRQCQSQNEETCERPFTHVLSLPHTVTEHGQERSLRSVTHTYSSA